MERKIKIIDDDNLRNSVVEIYEFLTHKDITQIAREYIVHTCQKYKFDSLLKNEIIKEAIEINKQWQNDKARMHDVRKCGFKIHKMARESETMIENNILRIIGHCIATGHMKEHLIVAFDYGIKLVNIKFNNINEIISERQFQISLLNQIKEQTKS